MKLDIDSVIENYCAIFQEYPKSREMNDFRSRLEQEEFFDEVWTEERVREMEDDGKLSAGEADAILWELGC